MDVNGVNKKTRGRPRTKTPKSKRRIDPKTGRREYIHKTNVWRLSIYTHPSFVRHNEEDNKLIFTKEYPSFLIMSQDNPTLFTSRDKAFRWFHKAIPDANIFDNIIIERINA